MTDERPYADYVRIEVRAGGETRVIEFKPLEGVGEDRPQVMVTPADRETDITVFGDLRPVRYSPPLRPSLRFEVSGPQMTTEILQGDQ